MIRHNLRSRILSALLLFAMISAGSSSPAMGKIDPVEAVVTGFGLFGKIFKSKPKAEEEPAKPGKAGTEKGSPQEVKISKKPEGPKGTTMDIVVKSEGISADDARQRAQREAVEKVVGIYLDAQTIVKRQTLVSDEVIRLVNGGVAGYEVIEEGPTASGGVIGKYRVKVKTAPIVTSVISNFMADIGEVDVSNLAADARSQVERNKAILAGLKKLLDEYPHNALTAIPVDFGLAGEIGLTEEVDVYVDVAIQWNQVWLYRFAKFLEAANTPGASFPVIWEQGRVETKTKCQNGLGQVTPCPVVDIYTVQQLFEIPVENVHVAGPIFGEIQQYFVFGREFGDQTRSVRNIEIAFMKGDRRLQLVRKIEKNEIFAVGRRAYPGYGMPGALGIVLDWSRSAGTLYVAGPKGEAMGLNTVYRFTAKVPLEVIEEMDGIRVTVSDGRTSK